MIPRSALNKPKAPKNFPIIAAKIMGNMVGDREIACCTAHPVREVGFLSRVIAVAASAATEFIVSEQTVIQSPVGRNTNKKDRKYGEQDLNGEGEKLNMAQFLWRLCGPFCRTI